MARRNRKLDVEGLSSIDSDRSFKKQLININNLIGQANLSLYGTDRTSDVDSLIKIKQKQIENINKQRQTLIYDYVTGKRRA